MSLLTSSIEVWPLKETFRISRGSRTETRIVVATIIDGDYTGRGEGVPIRRYQQTCESVLAQIESINTETKLTRQTLQNLLPPGAARNAVDCALWDLEAKRSGKRAWELLDFLHCSRRPAGDARAPRRDAATNFETDAVETSFTISLNSPEAMGRAAQMRSDGPILKLKLGGDDLDLARVECVRKAAPTTRLLIDANESWTPDHYRQVAPKLKTLGVELIEQPFPADADEVLETLEHPIPICADESCHTTADLPSLKKRYDMVNVKLDKTGGLTEALLLCKKAREDGFKLLIGCMVGTSLGMAPARLLASNADFTDLDGPLLLARDRDHGLHYASGKIGLPSRELWG